MRVGVISAVSLSIAMYLGVPFVVTPLVFWYALRMAARPIAKSPQGTGKILVQFSVRDILAVFVIASCILVAINQWGWGGGVVVSIAAIGAAIACAWSWSRRAWLAGVLLSLYIAFTAAVLFALTPASRLGWLEEWRISVPIVIVAVPAVVGGIITGIAFRWQSRTLAPKII